MSKTNKKIQIIDNFNKENYTLIDVRSKEEYVLSHLKGSINFELEKLFKNYKIKLNKKSKYLLYCHSGNRSQIAMDFLHSKGYENIFNIGGIIDFPTEMLDMDNNDENYY